MTVFTAEVAARRPSGFTIDSLIGNDKESGTSEKSARSKGSSEPCVRSNVPESPGPRVHRPTPIVSSTVVRPKAECSPCSALNLSLSAATSQQERVNLHNSKTHCDQPSVDGGPVFGVNYVDALSHPMVIRRGLPLSAQPNPQLWAHYSPDLHRNLSLNGPLFGRNPLRPPLPFTHGAGMMPFHPALISPPRDLFHPYHWNVRNQEGLPLPHLAGPGAGLFFHAFRKPKRHRTAFSPAQLLKLEHAFDRNQYVVGQERKALAEDLNLSETQVKVWFQNRRTKFKRVKAEGDPEDMEDSSANDTNCPIDNKVSHHVTRWKRDTNQVEVVDSDDEDNGSLVEEVEDQQMP